jgi:hypothetical protein
MDVKVIDWDGTCIPDALRDLPPGRYAIAPVDAPIALTDEEETGISRALDDLDAGRSMSLVDVVREIRGRASSK